MELVVPFLPLSNAQNDYCISVERCVNVVSV